MHAINLFARSIVTTRIVYSLINAAVVGWSDIRRASRAGQAGRPRSPETDTDQHGRIEPPTRTTSRRAVEPSVAVRTNNIGGHGVELKQRTMAAAWRRLCSGVLEPRRRRRVAVVRYRQANQRTSASRVRVAELQRLQRLLA